MAVSRRFMPLLLAAFVVVSGCGEGGAAGPTPQLGIWLNIYDKSDRIEILSSSTAKVTALFGEGIDSWVKTSPAQSGFGQEMQDAQKALAVYEQVEVSYVVDAKNETVTFNSETRGSRSLTWNGSDIMDDPSSLRAYLHQK